MSTSEVRSSHGGDTPLMQANFGPKYDQHLDEMRKKLLDEDSKHQNLRRMCDNHMYEEERYSQVHKPPTICFVYCFKLEGARYRTGISCLSTKIKLDNNLLSNFPYVVGMCYGNKT